MARVVYLDRYLIPSLILLVVFGILSFSLIGINDPHITILIDILIAVISGAFIATISIRYTFLQNKKLEYYEYMNSVLTEMDDNFLKLDQFPAQIDKLEKEWKFFKETWIQVKLVAVWPRSNRFFYQYLSDNQYNVLKNSGFFRKVKLVDLNNLALFYLYCIKFNDETQAIEDEIDDIRLFVMKELFNNHNFEDSDNFPNILKNITIKKSIDELMNKKRFILRFENKEYPFSLDLSAKRGHERVSYNEYIPIDDYFNQAIREINRLFNVYGANIRQHYTDITQNKKTYSEIITLISTPDMKSWLFGVNFY